MEGDKAEGALIGGGGTCCGDNNGLAAGDCWTAAGVEGGSCGALLWGCGALAEMGCGALAEMLAGVVAGVEAGVEAGGEVAAGIP